MLPASSFLREMVSSSPVQGRDVDPVPEISLIENPSGDCSTVHQRDQVNRVVLRVLRPWPAMVSRRLRPPALRYWIR